MIVCGFLEKRLIMLNTSICGRRYLDTSLCPADSHVPLRAMRTTAKALLRFLRTVPAVVFMLGLLSPDALPQTNAPWGISTTKKLMTVSGGIYASAALSPAGEVYLYGRRSPGGSGYSFPTPTITLGDAASPEVNYVTKIDSSGNPVYTIALGGTYQIRLNFDSASNLYVSGAATASGFFSTPGAYRSSPAGDRTSFVCKLRANGSPIYCTYLDVTGGAPLGVGVDRSGAALLISAGVTGAVSSPGALNRGTQIYIAKLNASGSALVYSATFGPKYQASVGGFAVDPSGNVVVVGQTDSPDYPTTSGVVVSTPPTSPGSQGWSFVTALNSQGTSLLYSTFGKTGEVLGAVAIDPSGAPQVSGAAADGTMVVRRYNSDASAVVFEKSLSGLELPAYPSMTVDAIGNTTIVSTTRRADIATLHPTSACYSGTSNYMVRLDTTGNIVQSTFLPDSASLNVQLVNDSLMLLDVKYLPSVDQLSVSEFDLLTVVRQPDAPGVPLACIGNSASLRNGPLAPGEIISIFGKGIGPSTPVVAQLAVGQTFPSELSGVTVTVNGRRAPLLYVSDTQINAVAPFTLDTTSAARVCVTYGGPAQSCYTAATSAASPGIFQYPANSESAAAVNQDGTINSQQNPAPAGSIISLYVNGLGMLIPPPPDGSLIGSPSPIQSLPISVAISSHDPRHYYVPAEVLYLGPAPLQLAGLTQINVRLPLTIAAPRESLQVTVTLPGDEPSWDGTWVWVK